MNCEEFERGWQQLEDASRLSPTMEDHRKLCPGCSELAEDLSYIIRQARQLLPPEEPSERLWEALRHQLQREGLIREPAPRRLVVPVPGFGWFQRMPMSLAYAAVFLVALGVVYLHSLLTNVPTPPTLARVPAVSEMALKKTASPERDQVFRQLAQKVSPEQRDIYVSNLERVNSSIQQLSAFVEMHPEDPFAREQLLTVYQQKQRLWESLVRWEEY